MTQNMQFQNSYECNNYRVPDCWRMFNFLIVNGLLIVYQLALYLLNSTSRELHLLVLAYGSLQYYLVGIPPPPTARPPSAPVQSIPYMLMI